MDKFVDHLRMGIPITLLHMLFPVNVVQEIFCNTLPQQSWRLFCIPKLCNTEWFVSYLEWIFDDCAISYTYPVYEEYPFDYCHGLTTNDAVINFFLARKAPSARGLDQLLARPNFLRINLRLLDAGATPKHLHKDHNLSTYYQIRQETRAAILAFLAARRRRPNLRQKVAREIWQEIAQLIWERRWDFFVGTRRERRYKIK